jgi:hypothetical protein
MSLDNALRDRQSKTCARIFAPRMQPLKDNEYPIGILLLKANSVVTDGKPPAI